jgi:hypothetical protein
MENHEPKSQEVGATPARIMMGADMSPIGVKRPDFIPEEPPAETPAETEAAHDPEKLADAALAMYLMGAMHHQKMLNELKPDGVARQALREKIVTLAGQVIADKPRLGYRAKLNMIIVKTGVIADQVIRAHATDIVRETSDI